MMSALVGPLVRFVLGMAPPARPGGGHRRGRASIRRTPAAPATRYTLSYPEVGATRHGPMPGGYRHLHHTTRVGRGRAGFEAAAAAVTGWRVHRESGARLRATGPRAEPGVLVEVSAGLGRLRVGGRCEVVWTAREAQLAGFAYGTLPGHPECGEESFTVSLREDGSVWFTVMAFSRPDRWYTRLAGPLVPPLQRAYARRLGRTVRRLAAADAAGRADSADTGGDGMARVVR